MGGISPVMQSVMYLLFAALLAAPGMFALWKGLHMDEEERVLRLQVQALADEVRRLQVLTDDQARKIAKLSVEVGTLESVLGGALDTATRLSMQVEQLGGVPVVNVVTLRKLLTGKGGGN